jgi:hypothetical protein
MLVICPASEPRSSPAGRLHAHLTEEADAVADEDGRDMDDNLVHQP